MKKIDLTEKELSVVAHILRNHPHVLVFGSRVNGFSRDCSNLNICLKKPISDLEYELLQEDFKESNLDFNVDLIHYNKVDDFFKHTVHKDGIELSEFLKEFHN